MLVLNCGSSSIKFALFDTALEPLPREPAWSGKVDGITSRKPTFSASDAPPCAVDLDPENPYYAALRHIRTRVLERLGGERLRAVAHRVVHGGAKYSAPVRVDARILEDLGSYVPLAPLHQPFALEAIAALLESNPELVQVACFDTAFHNTMPLVERLLPLPYSAYERGLRRYGFHGLSYEYLSVTLRERHGASACGRTIAAHLGSGASLCAMQDLRSMATSMGFSALDGLMMGTRTGALDPGALLYLMEMEKLDLQQVARMLYHDSGLLGVSGVSSDPRLLLPVEDSNPRVRVALQLYVRRIVREILSLAGAIGGLDMLVFTAGIGEHNAIIRQRICAGLGFLGVRIDAAANAAHAHVLSTQDSTVTVLIEPTNEEWIAARHAARLLSGH